MRIQHNIMAMNAYRNYNTNTSALSKNLEKLSSGYKINRAGDDAAGLAISEKMRAQITGLNAAQKNVKDGISLVKTAEGAMQEIQDMLNRMDYLATQSANGTYQDDVDREALQKEVNQLRDEINRIADSANFNGIKLLDGSQAAKQAVDASKIEASGAGVQLIDSVGAKRVQKLETGTFPTISKGEEGATVKISIGLSDGTTVQKTYTFAKNKDGELKNLVDEDGNVVTTLAAEKTVAEGEMDKLVQDVFAKDEKLASNFDLTVGTTGLLYNAAAKETGADTLEIKSFDIHALDKDGKAMSTTTTKYGVNNSTAGLDDGFEIDASKITLYDGTNADKAIFEINGHKFVLMTGDMQYTESSKDKHTSMNATSGLGSDVTILISDSNAKPNDAGVATVNGLMKADKNFDQNIKKIAEVTGLTVTDAIAEVDGTGAAAATGVAAGAGIRLSKGKSTEADGGLLLQIGDTADSYNQLRVGIGDMHCKALGIDGLSIANREDAAKAIDTIKNAINNVSSVRGDLGAYQNRLEHTANNLSVMAENITDAESTIRDTDVAEEMMSYVKNNILVQSAQAMLAQANQVPQGVLQLLG